MSFHSAAGDFTQVPAPVFSKTLSPTPTRSAPTLPDSLGRARAAALLELQSASKGYDLVSQLLSKKATRRAGDGSKDSPTRSPALPPVDAPTVPEDNTVPAPVAASKSKKKGRRKKAEADAEASKALSWGSHPLAQPKEALMCLDGGALSRKHMGASQTLHASKAADTYVTMECCINMLPPIWHGISCLRHMNFVTAIAGFFASICTVI